MNRLQEFSAIRAMYETGKVVMAPKHKEANSLVKGMSAVYALVLYPILRLTGETATEIQSREEGTQDFFQHGEERLDQIAKNLERLQENLNRRQVTR